MKKYVVYQITNKINGMIYVGVHYTTNIHDNYMGSGKLIKKDIKKLGKKNFKKEILFVYITEQEALNKEAEIVNIDFINRTDTYNIVIGGGKLVLKNCVVVKDKEGNIFTVNINDSRYISKELIPLRKNKIKVKDKLDNIFYTEKNDPKFLSGELIHHSIVLKKVKDKENNIFYIDRYNSDFLSGKLIKTKKGMVVAKDINNIYYHISINDPRYLSGELVHITTGFFVAKDKNNKKYYIAKDDPRYLSGELTHFHKGTKRSDLTKLKMKENAPNKNGINNGCFEKICIHNIELNKNKFIKKEELENYLILGWLLGTKNKGKKYKL